METQQDKMQKMVREYAIVKEGKSRIVDRSKCSKCGRKMLDRFEYIFCGMKMEIHTDCQSIDAMFGRREMRSETTITGMDHPAIRPNSDEQTLYLEIGKERDYRLCPDCHRKLVRIIGEFIESFEVELEPKNMETKGEKLDKQFLADRGFIPVTALSVMTIIYNKWGLEIDVHGDFTYCMVRTNVPGFSGQYIETKDELLDLEKKMNIDRTPNIIKMSVDELIELLPDGYTYTLDESQHQEQPARSISFSQNRGRYKITKNGELICNGYNDQTEHYFLAHSLMYILDVENKMIRNE